MAIKTATSEKSEISHDFSKFALEEMSIAQLKALKEKASELIDAKYESEKADALSKMRQLAAASGFTLEEIITGLDPAEKPKGFKRKPMKAKYLHPDGDTTWTGVGKAPRWITEYEANGGSRDDLLIG